MSDAEIPEVEPTINPKSSNAKRVETKVLPANASPENSKKGEKEDGKDAKSGKTGKSGKDLAGLRLGFDLGGTKMLAVLYDSKWNELARRRKRTKSGDSKAGVKRIIQIIEDLLEQADIKPKQVASIGVGCPGPVDMRAGTVREAVNLNWENVKLKRALESEFPAHAEVLNDVDAGVFGEHQFGAAQGARTVVGVFPGTGIGGGCVYNGQVLTGKGVSCMEIGHLQVQSDGPLCGCGAHGCLETLASRLAISAEVAKAIYRGEAPAMRELIGGANLFDIRSGVLAKAVEGGDQVVEAIIRRAARQVGMAMASLVHLMAPDQFVLGGGLVEAMPKLWVEEVQSAANQKVMMPYRDTFKVRAAKLGDDATVWGAAAWAWQALQASR